ncbi:unnamed protein product [Amoebophrya sp. A25]|nr:unnamed protein product [Amoebophrya sp. A25]|eukprot:GSA25T00005284001.1
MFPVRFLDNLDGLSKGTEIYKRLTRIREKKDRHLNLAFCNLTDYSLPNFTVYTHLTKIDLGYNNLQSIPAEVSMLEHLVEILAMDNPLLYHLPVSLASLKKLRVLDVRNTAVSEIPREYAELQASLRDLNLSNCPLKPNLRMAYGKGYLSLFQYLRRKNDRRKFKKELYRQFREDLYPFDAPQALQEKVDSIFASMKDFTSFDLRKLTRHAPRILPDVLTEIDEKLLRQSILQIVEEDQNTQYLGKVALKLRSMYCDSPFEFAATLAKEIFMHFPPEDVEQIFSKDIVYILESDYKNVNLDNIQENLTHLRHARWYKSICDRIRTMYSASDAVTDALVDQIFERCLESAHHDKAVVTGQLEKVLPLTWPAAMEALENNLSFPFRLGNPADEDYTDAEGGQGAGLDVSMETSEGGDGGLYLEDTCSTSNMFD